MKSMRIAGIVASLIISLLLAGCGDVYRPVVIPFPTQGTDPQLQGFVFTLNQGVQLQPVTDANGNEIKDANGNPVFPVGEPCVAGSNNPEPCLGSTTDIDVPGDVNVGNHVVGRDPWSAFLIGSAVFVANRDDNSVSFYSPFSSFSQPSSLMLPSSPVFIGSTQADRVYAALPGTNKVGVVDLASGVFSQDLVVGTKPVALVELPNRTKLYVINQESASISVFSTTGPTQLGNPIPIGPNPVWAIATPDSNFVLVLSFGASGGNMVLTAISTATDSVTSSETAGGAATVPTGVPMQNPMIFDRALQRVYVANPADGTVTVFDISRLGKANLLPTEKPLENIGVVHVLPAGAQPFSVAVLSDNAHNGSRAYVLSKVGSAGDASVSVIDTSNLAVSQVNGFNGKGPRGIVASSDGTKVYVANHQASMNVAHPNIVSQQPGTSIIRTSDNTVLDTYVKAPFQDPASCKFDTPQPWIGGLRYTAGDTVVPSADPNAAYQATKTGVSGASEPAFSACTGDATSTVSPASCTVADGDPNTGVIWRPVGKSKTCPRQRPNFIFAQ